MFTKTPSYRSDSSGYVTANEELPDEQPAPRFTALRRSSFRSDSSGGYDTPNEELPEGRTVRFSNHVEERTFHEPGEFTESSQTIRNQKGEKKKKSKRLSSATIRELTRMHYPQQFRRPKLGRGFAARVFRRYPRTYACTLGIVIPLWVLVLLSLLCGKFLGELEAPGELDANDAAMRQRMLLKTYTHTVSDTLAHLPTVCYLLYKNQTTTEQVKMAFMGILEEESTFENWLRNQVRLTGQSIVNVSSFSEFMVECGKSAENYTHNRQQYWREKNMDFTEGGDTSLSFDWNRCVNQTGKEFNRIFNPSTQDILDARFQAQEQIYQEVWEENFETLRKQYLQEYISADQNNSVQDSRFQAYNRSLHEATGRHTCTVNIASAAWFWFTIMSTVGYGNQSPESVGGRVMVFTAGFLSILLFGTVLAGSGTIISHIVFDVVHRLGLKILLKKQVMLLVWGLLWLAWMFVLSGLFINWSFYRLEQDIPWEDAYWFSYISTATIGLGDFYLSPEELYIVDLLVFSLSFLFGFVLLSTFLSELGQLLAQNLPDMSLELSKRLFVVGFTDTDLDSSSPDFPSEHPYDDFEETIEGAGEMNENSSPEASPRASLGSHFRGHIGEEDKA